MLPLLALSTDAGSVGYGMPSGVGPAADDGSGGLCGPPGCRGPGRPGPDERLGLLKRPRARQGGRTDQSRRLAGRNRRLHRGVRPSAREGPGHQKTRWRIMVSTARRTLTLLRGGHPIRTISVVVRKPSTPTPLGLFAVAWAIPSHPTDFLGSAATAASAWPTTRSTGSWGRSARPGCPGHRFRSASSARRARLAGLEQPLAQLVLEFGRGIELRQRRQVVDRAQAE
jgi:hypothetical protein